jgi:hypothetical protein
MSANNDEANDGASVRREGLPGLRYAFVKALSPASKCHGEQTVRIQGLNNTAFADRGCLPGLILALEAPLLELLAPA